MKQFKFYGYNFNTTEVKNEDKGSLIGRIFKVTSKDLPSIEINFYYDGCEVVAVSEYPELVRIGKDAKEVVKSILRVIV